MLWVMRVKVIWNKLLDVAGHGGLEGMMQFHIIFILAHGHDILWQAMNREDFAIIQEAFRKVYIEVPSVNLPVTLQDPVPC